jgi:transcriptional regulator with XRE-family HTH domain
VNDVGAILRGIGRRIAELRVARNITQEELAERLDVSVGYVRQVEGGAKNLSVRSLAAFADVVGADVAELLRTPRTTGKRARARRKT